MNCISTVATWEMSISNSGASKGLASTENPSHYTTEVDSPRRTSSSICSRARYVAQTGLWSTRTREALQSFPLVTARHVQNVTNALGPHLSVAAASHYMLRKTSSFNCG